LILYSIQNKVDALSRHIGTNSSVSSVPLNCCIDSKEKALFQNLRHLCSTKIVPLLQD